MKGWSNVLRALLWAGCRGQIDGILGGPPKGDDELRQKLMYLWMVAEKGAEKENLRKPLPLHAIPGGRGMVEGRRVEPPAKRVSSCRMFVWTQGTPKFFHGGTSVTSCHVRDGLVDAEAVADDEVIVADLPVPARRLRAKARLALIIINPVEDLEAYARELDVDEMYGVENVMSIWERLKNISKPKRRGAKAAVGSASGESFYAGCFAHGGVCGIMNMVRKLPNRTAYLVKAAKEITGEDQCGCVAIVENVGMGPHKDSHNQKNTRHCLDQL